MLHEFITAHRDEIVARCRAKAATRANPTARRTAIEHGVPVFLEQLATVMRLRLDSSPEIAETALLHGGDLLRQGFSIAEVVHDYGDVCQSVTELAVELGATISADDFRLLNRCLDDAIAGAVTEYGRERHQSDIDNASAGATKYATSFADKVDVLNKTALIAFDVIRTGNVGVTGSTGGVLHRSLLQTGDLINRWRTEFSEGTQELFPTSAEGMVAHGADDIGVPQALGPRPPNKPRRG